jgi:hypothetical protein
MYRNLMVVVSAAILAWPSSIASPAQPAAEAPRAGARISRTMTLLASSTPEHRNHVRVLFYGQSVTAGVWWKEVAEWLRKTYPNADLEIENRAIGGFSAPVLIHTAESDLYPFYPDLLVFHVYGGHQSGELEELIAQVRRRTTADIVIRTPHYRWPKTLARDGSPDSPDVRRLSDEDEAQSATIRQIAEKYCCELADVRRQWQQHMHENKLLPKDLLADSVHLNREGNHLLAQLVIPHLRCESAPAVARASGEVRDVPLAGVKRMADGSIEIPFHGNRVDAVAGPVLPGKAGSVQVWVDGRRPSQFPEAFCCTRPSTAPGVWWPAITRVEHEKPLVAEKWTLRVLKSDALGKEIAFEVTGSQTGPDGQGLSTARFVSRSGRVVIEPKRWMVHGALTYRKLTMPAGFQVTWEVRPMYVDDYQAPTSRQPGLEYATTVIQGIANTRHTLRLVSSPGAALDLQAIRVYRPPLE